MRDYDLEECLSNNTQDGFGSSDIQYVLAVWEGHNDGDDWRWILQLKDGRYVYLQGGCDFTGWDCQSWASSVFAETAEAAALYALGDFNVGENDPVFGLGLGRMLGALTGTYMNNTEEVYNSLVAQIANGKNETWREKMAREFELTDEDEGDV